jgi:hypothetical protein
LRCSSRSVRSCHQGFGLLAHRQSPDFRPRRRLAGAGKLTLLPKGWLSPVSKPKRLKRCGKK